MGLETPDDAAVYRLDGERALVASLDFFTPLVDGPEDFGAIAAANALSDLYAMHATPLFALNILAIPAKQLAPEVIAGIISGAVEVCEALKQSITSLPAQLRRSLTWDQGSEMSEHRRFAVEAGVEVYFCDPRSPWQRGSNENTNGLLRQYFPKGVSLAGVD